MFQYLKSNDTKALICYLVDVFGQSMTFSVWITQPFLFDCGSEESLAMVKELMELQNNDGMKPIHAVRNEMMWLDFQVSAKYSKLAVVAQQALLPFPTTYLIEYAFSSVTDILTNK